MGVVAGGEGEGRDGNGDGDGDAAGVGPVQQVQRPIFLYRLVPGRAAPSFGLHCAALAGVPAGVLARARAVINAQQRGSALRSAPPPALVRRVDAARALAQRLAVIGLRERAGVATLLEGALALAGEVGQGRGEAAAGEDGAAAVDAAGGGS